MIQYLKDHPNFKLVAKNRTKESFDHLVIRNEAGQYRNSMTYSFQTNVCGYTGMYTSESFYPEVFRIAEEHKSKVFLKLSSGEIELKKEWFKRQL